jgi:hypothetical protein
MKRKYLRCGKGFGKINTSARRMIDMAVFTVRQGGRYRATLTLGWLERWASNDLIAEKLRAAGFSDITVAGSGWTRIAEASWPGPDATAEMPSQITEVTDLTGGAVAAQH